MSVQEVPPSTLGSLSASSGGLGPVEVQELLRVHHQKKLERSHKVPARVRGSGTHGCWKLLGEKRREGCGREGTQTTAVVISNWMPFRFASFCALCS